VLKIILMGCSWWQLQSKSTYFYILDIHRCSPSPKSNSINPALKNTNLRIYTILSMRKKRVFLCFNEPFFTTHFVGCIPKGLRSETKQGSFPLKMISLLTSPRNGKLGCLIIISLTSKKRPFNQHSSRLPSI
jgi:hypothetical protein